MTPVWHDLPEREIGPAGRGRSGRFGGAMFWPASMAMRLLWITVALWAVSVLLYSLPGTRAAALFVFDTFALVPGLWRAWAPFVPLWQIVSYGFLHAVSSPTHILFNMLGLYFFGRMVEDAIGPRRFLWMWLAAIAVGGFVQLSVHLLSAVSVPTIGASGAVIAMVCAAAVLQPNATVIFFVFPLKLRTFALLYVGLDLFQLLQGGGQTAYVVHLSGALFGFLAARMGWMWLDMGDVWRRRKVERQAAAAESDEARLDALLAQINAQGLGSLSTGDREFLKRMSAGRGAGGAHAKRQHGP